MSDLEHYEDLALGATSGWKRETFDCGHRYGVYKEQTGRPAPIAFRASTRGRKKAVTLPKVSIQK